MKSVFSGLVILAGLVVLGPSAHGTAFTLNCPQGGGACNGNFGTVNLTQNGPNVDVLVSLTAGFFVTTGNHHAFSFNITGAPAITITNLSPANTFVAGAAGANPGYGNYNYTIDCTICQGGTAPGGGPTLSFTVGKANLSTLLISDFTTNGNGFSFASDIFLNGATGVVAANGDPGRNNAGPTPEPTSAVLMLSGLVGLFWFRRRYITA